MVKMSQSVVDEQLILNMATESTELLKVIKDPIHGSIQLHPLLMKIINTESFNRLKYIRQLGGLFYVYPGATHTRFEHSIGVCYLAGEYARMLQRKHPDLNISEGDILNIEIAGLCHDLGHGPFSHLFDRVLNNLTTCPKKLRHEYLSVMIFQHIFDTKELKEAFDKAKKSAPDLELSVIEDMIDPDLDKMLRKDKMKFYTQHDTTSGVKMFLYEIVANKSTGIDVDKWDYFIRDCHYMGLQCEFDYRRLMQLSCIREVDFEFGCPTESDPFQKKTTKAWRICYSEKEANNILGMFRTRASLHEKAYRHKTVIAVEHRLSTALLHVKGIEFVYSIAKVGKKRRMLSMVEIFHDLNKKEPVLDGYLALTDDIIHVILNMDPNICCEDNEAGKKKIKKDPNICCEDNKAKIKLKKAQDNINNLFVREIFHRVNPTTVSDIVTKKLSKAGNFHDFLQEKIIANAVSSRLEDIKKGVLEQLKGKTSEEAKKEYYDGYEPQRSRLDIVSELKPEKLSEQVLLDFYKDHDKDVHLYLTSKLIETMLKCCGENLEEVPRDFFCQCLEKKELILKKLVKDYFYDIILLMLPHILSSCCEEKEREEEENEEEEEEKKLEQQKMKPEDRFLFEKVKLSYGSEKGTKTGPLVESKVLFFSKDNPEPHPLEKVSPLFAPREYDVTDVWIYSPVEKLDLITRALGAMVEAGGN